MILEYTDGEVPLAICNDGEKDYLESPMMTDGTIEEDFEKALAKEVALAGEVGSPETPVVTSKIIEGDKTDRIEEPILFISFYLSGLHV